MTMNDNSSDQDYCQYRISEKQATIYVGTTAAFAAIGALGCVITIIMVLQSKAYRSYIHRLTLYVAIASFFAAVSTGIAVLPVNTLSSTSPFSLRGGSGWNDTCVTFAFFLQYFTFSSTFATLWVSSNVFTLAMCRVSPKQYKCDVAGLLFTFLVPLFVAWIPFIDDTFGLTTVWCWVKDRCYRGPKHSLGFQFGATLGPVSASYVASLVMIIVISIKFTAGYFGMRGQLRYKHWKVLKELMPLVIYALACCLVYVFGLFSSFYFVLHDKIHGAVALAVIACSLQVVRLLLPVVVLLHPSFKLRCRNPFSRWGEGADGKWDSKPDPPHASVGIEETSTCVISEVDPILNPQV